MCNRLDGFKSSYYIHDSTELITIRQGKFKNMTAIHIQPFQGHTNYRVYEHFPQIIWVITTSWYFCIVGISTGTRPSFMCNPLAAKLKLFAFVVDIVILFHWFNMQVNCIFFFVYMLHMCLYVYSILNINKLKLYMQVRLTLCWPNTPVSSYLIE